MKALYAADFHRRPAAVGAKTPPISSEHQEALITRRPTGYFIAHVEGEMFPTINGASLGSAAHPLKDQDVIELAGVKMEFSNPSAAG